MFEWLEGAINDVGKFANNVKGIADQIGKVGGGRDNRAPTPVPSYTGSVSAGLIKKDNTMIYLIGGAVGLVSLGYLAIKNKWI